MAAYPPGPSRLFQLPDLAGGQAPGDLAYLVDVSLGTNAGDPSDVKSSLNDLFAEITKNVSDLSIQFANGLGTSTVSAANKGKIRYNSTAQSFQVSESGGAYENLIKGTGLNQQVSYWTSADTLAGDTAFVWDATNDRLGIGVTVASSVAPLNVRADGSALAQQWFPNSVTDNPRARIEVTSSDARIGMSTAHPFYINTNSLERISVESGGAVAINRTSPAQAQLHVDAATNVTTAFLANNASGSSVDIGIFQVNGSNRLRITQTGEIISGSSSTQDGKLTLASAGAAFTQSLMAGTAPVATNSFRWPNANPTLGQALTASAPSAGVVTLSWTTITGASPGGVTNSVQINNGGGAFDGDAKFTYDTATSTVIIGASSGVGKLKLRGTGVSNGVSFVVNNPASDFVYTLPDAAPTLNQFLQATAVSGANITLGWASGGGSGTPGGSDTQMQYNNAGAFGGVSGFTSDGTNVTAGSGNLRATSPRITTAIADANGNAIIGLTATASAVNYLTVTNTVTAASPANRVTISTAGTDTTIPIRLNPKNTGTYPNGPKIIFPSGTRYDDPEITWDGLTGIGIHQNSGGGWFSINCNNLALGAGGAGGTAAIIGILANTQIAWGSSTATPIDDPPGQDVGIARRAAGVLRITNASTGQGSLLIAPSTASATAPLDVVAQSSDAAAQTWREFSAGPARVQMLVPSSYGQLGTSTAHAFSLMTNNLQRVNIESGGAVVVGSIIAATGQLMSNALATGSISLVANNLSGTTVDIAQFQVNAANRFRFLNTGELIAGLASTATGKLTLANASGTTLTSISAGNAASTLNFIWPVVDPTAGQVLSAAAPSGGDVVLSWIANGSGGGNNPGGSGSELQFRGGATTFSAVTGSSVSGANISLAGTLTQTVSSATAFTVGPNGTTNPTMNVVTNVASAATGISITGNAAGSRVSLNVISSGTNEGLDLLPKGTGNIRIVPGAAAGTALRIDPAASQTADLMQVTSDGTNIRFRLDSAGRVGSRGMRVGSGAESASISYDQFVAEGTVTINATGSGGYIRAASNVQIGFNSSTDNPNGSALDTILRRNAAANFALGATDAASPVAQTLSVQGVSTGTANTAGVSFTIQGSRSTGNAAGGSIIFQTTPLGSAGTTQNAYVTALTIPAAGGFIQPELSADPSTPSANTGHWYTKDNGSGLSRPYFRGDDGTVLPLGTAALTATFVGYGDSGGLLTGSNRFTWDNTNRALTLGESANSGQVDITLRSTNTASALVTGSAASRPGSQGGVVFPNVGGDQTQGPGLTWSDGTYANTSRLYISLGLNWQGYDTGGQSLNLRKSTATSSQGATVFEFRPNDGYAQLNPFGTSAGNTTEIRFLELAANGFNYVSLKAPDSIGSTNPVIVLPSSSAPSVNDVLTVTAVSLGVITTAWQPTSGGGGANTALSNLASVSINTSLLAQSGVDLGAAATAFKDLYLYGSGTYGSTSLRLTGTPTGNRVVTIPDATGTLTLGSNSTAGAIPKSTSNVLSDSIMVESASPATITTSGRHVISGITISTDATDTVGSLDTSFSVTKNNSNSRTFYGVRVQGTLNTGGSNTNTTVNLLHVDTTNTAVTGLTVNLLQLRYGGTIFFNVDSAGGITFAEQRQAFAPNATQPGLNVGSVSGNPSSLVNGDLWYDSTANQLKARINGSTVSLGAGGGSPGGINSQIQYNSSGSFGGISTFSSDGTLLAIAATVTTGSGSTAGLNATANSLTTGNAFEFSSSSVSSGRVVNIAATGTAAASNTKTALSVATSGANATSTQTTYAGRFSNTSTGTTSTNIGMEAAASGGTNNYAAVFTSGWTAWGGTSSTNIAFIPSGRGGAFRRADDSNVSDNINAGAWYAGIAGGYKALIDSGVTLIGASISSDGTLYFSSSTSANAGLGDLSLVRAGTNTLRVGRGTSSGIGFVTMGRLVTAQTSNYTVVANDSNTFFTNAGATGTVVFTLPTASAGLTYTFYIDATQTLQVTAGASTTIRSGSSVTSSAGNVSASTQGNVIRIVAISSTQWVAESITGTWTFA